VLALCRTVRLMAPDAICSAHGEQLEIVRRLAETIHQDRQPGWYRSLPERLTELVTQLKSFRSCYGCCRSGDRLGSLVSLLLLDFYREYLPVTQDRKLNRNLRRSHYDLTGLVRGLDNGPASVLLTRAQPYGLDVVQGSRLDVFLQSHGEDLSLVPASHNLSTFVAFQRGLHPYHWTSYSVSPMDGTLLQQHGRTPKLRRFGSRGVTWISETPAVRFAVLERLGWLDHLSRPAKDTLAALQDGWYGSIDDLISASDRLS
jgi:hypothetical protein